MAQLLLWQVREGSVTGSGKCNRWAKILESEKAGLLLQASGEKAGLIRVPLGYSWPGYYYGGGGGGYP